MIPVQIQEGGGYAKFRVDFGYQELCTLYYIIRIHTITLDITYLSSRTKPAGNCKGRSRNTDLTTRGQDRGVVTEITGTIHSLVLDFCVCAIYKYTNPPPHLQTNRESITGPVESKSGIVDPDRLSYSSSHDHCHVLILGVNVVGLRPNFHWARITCSVSL